MIPTCLLFLLFRVLRRSAHQLLRPRIRQLQECVLFLAGLRRLGPQLQKRSERPFDEGIQKPPCGARAVEFAAVRWTAADRVACRKTRPQGKETSELHQIPVGTSSKSRRIWRQPNAGSPAELQQRLAGRQPRPADKHALSSKLRVADAESSSKRSACLPSTTEFCLSSVLGMAEADSSCCSSTSCCLSNVFGMG